MSQKVYATFVLPAPNGCNLDCPFCVIAHRQEAVTSKLTHEDYIYFLTDILIHHRIERFSIQGFEPLLPETWPLTKAMLRIAGKFFCESSLVTNGTYLAEHAQELGRFPDLLDTITVSLDSADASVHDKLRRVVGSHESALEGMRAVSKRFSGELIVNSVLFPGKSSFLTNMPELLDKFGIREWAISPFINVGRVSKVLHGVELKQSMLELTDRAADYGIKVFLSDELRLTAGNDLFKEFYIRTLGTEEEIFRLAPDGSCSRGMEVLGTAQGAPIWDARENPSAFLSRIFGEINVPLRNRGLLASSLAQWHAKQIVSTMERS